MPILYVHGVNVRTEDSWRGVERRLREHIAPEISVRPGDVLIRQVFWGDVGVRFAFDGASRPRSSLLGMGPDSGALPGGAGVLAGLPGITADLPAEAGAAGSIPAGLLAAGPAEPAAGVPVRLAELSPAARESVVLAALGEDLFADAAAAAGADRRVGALREVLHDPALPGRLAACPDLDAELALLAEEASARMREGEPLLGMGALDWFRGAAERVRDALRFMDRTPGIVAGRVASELRRPVNDLVTRFLGDVFVYLGHRGNAAAPGEIPKRALAIIEEARVARGDTDEPLVVVTHSMGGQVIYDLVTHFLPALPAAKQVRVDFWAAAASQVGLFEEMKLFHASSAQYSRASGQQVPLPDRHFLGAWWNVWDPADWISYTTREIFAEGVDDEPYETALPPPVLAHLGYLEQPGFYKRMVEKLRAAKGRNWDRP